MIRSGTFEFPSPYWDDVSELAKDLVKKLLVVNPAQRLDADGIMSHPWIKGDDTPRDDMPSVLANIRRYNARRRLKKAGTAIIGSIRWRKLTQANKQNAPQSTKQMDVSQSAAAAQSMADNNSPQQNNFMQSQASQSNAGMSEGDSMTPNNDATLHIRHDHGFNESTQELDMRSEESKEF